MNLHELGVTKEMLSGIADETLIMEGGYKVLKHDEVLDILKISLTAAALFLTMGRNAYAFKVFLTPCCANGSV